MAQPITMPKLGQTAEESTIVKWHKAVGDKIRKGDIIFEIETDKAVLEVESFFDGTLLKIYTGAGETVPVMTVVAMLGEPGEKAPDTPPSAATAPAKPTPPPAAAVGAPPAPPATLPPTPGRAAPAAPAPALPSSAAIARKAPAAVLDLQPPPAARLAISPRARALAKRAAIDFQPIRGTGPNARIVEADVRAYMAANGYDRLRITPAALILAVNEGINLLTVRGGGDEGRIVVDDIRRVMAERPRRMSKMRSIIADRLTQSFTTTPHFFVTVSVDMTDLLEYRKQLKAQNRDTTVTVFVLEAVILALAEFPIVNSRCEGHTIRWNSRVHLGMATALDEGLVVPVIHDADGLSLAELQAKIGDLASKARDGKLLPDEMSGSTFTVSNMGMLNIEEFTAIINPGEGAILAVASTQPTPVVRDGRVVIRSMMKITLSSDHRIIDGSVAARFINAIKTRLEDIELWKTLTS